MTNEHDGPRHADEIWRALQPDDADGPWAAVERRLDGLLAEDRPRPGIDRRRLRRRILLLLVVVLVGGALGWLIAGLGGIDTGRGATPSSSALRDVVALTGIGTAVVIWAVGFARGLRRGRSWFSFQEPTRGLPRAERRSVELTIRGRRPADPERLRTLRRLAIARLDQSEWMLWLFGGWLFLSIGQAASGWGAWTGWLQFVLAVLWVVGLVVVTRQRRSWRAFIAEHPVAESTGWG